MIHKGSRAEQFTYHTSHRQYRNKLHDIKHNTTANNYLPKRPYSTKKLFNIQKHQQRDIDIQIKALKSKRQSLNNKTQGKISQFVSTGDFFPQRYIEGQSKNKIKINYKFQEGQLIKLAKPSSSNYPQAVNNKMSQIQKSYKKFTSYNLPRDGQKEIIEDKQKETLYNLPERNQNRRVLYKKTLILGSMQSCLIELFLIEQRLIVAAHLLGLQNVTLRQIYSVKKTASLLQQYRDRYEQLCSQVTIQQKNNKYHSIQLLAKEDQGKQTKTENQDVRKRQKAKIQSQFIKRNYYTISRDEEVKDLKIQRPNVSYQYVQSVVQRLSAPKVKRLSYLRQPTMSKTERQQKTVSNYCKVQSQSNIRSLQKLETDRPIGIQVVQKLQSKKIHIPKKQIQKQQNNWIDTLQPQKDYREIQLKQENIHKENQELSQNQEKQYLQSFEKSPHIDEYQTLFQRQNIENRMQVQQKEQLHTLKQQEKQYEDEQQQRQEYEQIYEQSYEQKEKQIDGKSPIVDLQSNKNVEEEYQQEFS